MTNLYKHAVLGGTFDHLHLGHKKFINHALSLSSKLSIGIVQESWTNAKIYPNSIESFQVRLSSLQSFIALSGASHRVHILPIQDIFGTTLTDSSLDAIFVTESTKQNALLINSKRKELFLPRLPIIIVPYEISRDGGIISSSRIRLGEIDRSGFVYKSILGGKKSLILPDSLRASLKKPVGDIMTDLTQLKQLHDSKPDIIAVGDIVSLDLLDSGYHPAVMIVDLRNKREPLKSNVIKKYSLTPQFHLLNEPGTINCEFGEIITKAMAESVSTNTTQIIQVTGEEDLLALPTMLLASLNSYVIYGQNGSGFCAVKITESIKNLSQSYLSKFE